MTFDLHCTTTAWFRKCCLSSNRAVICFQTITRRYSLRDTIDVFYLLSSGKVFTVIASENKQVMSWDDTSLRIQSTLLEVIRAEDRKINCRATETKIRFNYSCSDKAHKFLQRASCFILFILLMCLASSFCLVCHITSDENWFCGS